MFEELEALPYIMALTDIEKHRWRKLMRKGRKIDERLSALFNEELHLKELRKEANEELAKFWDHVKKREDFVT